MDTMGEFDAIFAEYHERLVRYLGRILRDPALAQDLAQETLFRVYKAEEELRNPEARTAWIYRIATNLALDHLRRRRGGDAQWHVIQGSEELDDAADTATSSGDLSADDRLEQQEMAECLRVHVHELSETLRTCLILRDVEGLGEKPVAEILGCSVGAVKVRTHRARKELRERLHQGCHFYKDGRGALQCPGCRFYEDGRGGLQCAPAEGSAERQPE